MWSHLKMINYIFGALAGIATVLGFSMFYDGTYGNVRNTVFEGCSVGQNLTLRETVGTSTFEVTFKDGEFASYTCTSNPAPPAN